MDSLPPPRVIVENTAHCADAANASEQVGKITSETTAPESWVVAIRIRDEGAGLLGIGEIRDGQGDRVAIRELSSPTGETCTPLARMLGLWATLALEARFDPKKGAETNVTPGGAPSEASNHAAPPPPAFSATGAPRPPRAEPVWRSIRIGLSSAAMTDGLLSVVVGPAAYLALETRSGALLMPHLALGYPVYRIAGTTDPAVTTPALATGLDACGQLGAGGAFVFEECVTGQLDFGITHNTLFTPALGFAQGFRVGLGPRVWLNARIRALFNFSIIGNANQNSTELGAQQNVSPYLLEGELGLSWNVK